MMNHVNEQEAVMQISAYTHDQMFTPDPTADYGLALDDLAVRLSEQTGRRFVVHHEMGGDFLSYVAEDGSEVIVEYAFAVHSEPEMEGVWQVMRLNPSDQMDKVDHYRHDQPLAHLVSFVKSVLE